MFSYETHSKKEGVDVSAGDEIFKDFTVGVRLFHPYDSKPPSATANKEDYGFSTTIGFKFRGDRLFGRP